MLVYSFIINKLEKELPSYLTYHSAQHTKDVIEAAQYISEAEKISGNDSLASSYHLSNHFSFLNVPFTASYKMRWANSFKTSLKAGILLNISSNYKGKMPDAFGALADINNAYIHNTGVSIYTAVNFSKPVTHKLDVFAEPYFRFQTKNITSNLQPFTRKIQTAGLALGIEFKLCDRHKPKLI